MELIKRFWFVPALALLALILLLIFALRYRRLKKERSRQRTVIDNSQRPLPNTVQTFEPVEESTALEEAADMPLAAAYHQDIGERQNQQDSFAITALSHYDTVGVLAIVADGMGGLANGALVSRTLTESFVSGFQLDPQRPPVELLLHEAIDANVKINKLLLGAEKSGSTLVAAIIKNGFLSFLSVGDSRIYLWRGNALLQLNREHIFQEELVIEALNRKIKPEQVTEDKQAKALTSYFGVGQVPHLDRNYEPIRLLPGDRILLMSDGVFGTLGIDEMEEAMRCTLASSAEALGRMVKERKLPYQDNNTVIILEYRG